ncbi:MAG: hypothetical protein IT289_08875 [Oligoflexia bacterium]|nr:hypothetical protein [Oligoflexia bacterium]
MFKPVLKPAEVEGHVLEYKPRPFSQTITQQALDFSQQQQMDNPERADFSINPLVAETTGLSEIERKSFNARVEAEVLSKLKIIEEKAYGEAYSLGLKEGREKAFSDTAHEIKSAIESLGSMVTELTELKKRLLIENEGHLVKTIFHVAKALALREISTKSEAILDVLRASLESAQSEEEVKVIISQKDKDFLDQMKGQMGNPLERIPKVKVEVNDSISPGGCVVETNFGAVDATIETRINKLFATLESKVPKTDEGKS